MRQPVLYRALIAASLILAACALVVFGFLGLKNVTPLSPTTDLVKVIAPFVTGVAVLSLSRLPRLLVRVPLSQPWRPLKSAESGRKPHRHTELVHDAELAGSVITASRSESNSFRVAGEPVSPLKLFIFGTMLTTGRRLFQGRIVENITAIQGRVRHRVTTSLLLDFADLKSESGAEPIVGTAPAEAVFYPLAVIRKGEILDNFHLNVKGFEGATTLTYEEYCQLMVLTVRALAHSIGEVPLKVRLRLDEVVSAVLRIICRRQVASDNYAKISEYVENVCEEISEITRELQDDGNLQIAVHDSLKQIQFYASTYWDKYAIVVLLPKECVESRRAIVRFERDLPLRWSPGRTWRGRFLQRILLLTGSRSTSFSLDLARASDAQSYHIYFEGPANSYLLSQRLTGVESYAMYGHPEVVPHVRFRKPIGQSYARGYFRDLERLPSGSSRTLRLLLRFSQVPSPRDIRPVLVAAIVAFGVWSGYQQAVSVPPDVVSALVLLGAATAIAALVFAADAGAYRSSGSELAPRVSGGISLSLSFTALILASGVSTPSSLAGYIWIVLLLLALCNVLVVFGVWFDRIYRYSRVLRAAGRNSDTDGIVAVAAQSRRTIEAGENLGEPGWQ